MVDPTPAPSPATPPQPGASQQHKHALYEAVGDVIRTQAAEREAERAAAERRRGALRRVSPVLIGCLVILASIGAYVAVERPEWLFPTPVVVESSAEQEASLRIALATTAQRIERFKREHGQLPAKLADVGLTATPLGYQPAANGTYVLRGRNGSIELSYSSSDALAAFVGSSFEVLARRTHR